MGYQAKQSGTFIHSVLQQYSSINWQNIHRELQHTVSASILSIMDKRHCVLEIITLATHIVVNSYCIHNGRRFYSQYSKTLHKVGTTYGSLKTKRNGRGKLQPYKKPNWCSPTENTQAVVLAIGKEDHTLNVAVSKIHT